VKSKEYDNVVTSPNSYRKIVQSETKVIPLHVAHIYMTAHIPDFARLHRYKVTGFNKFYRHKAPLFVKRFVIILTTQ